MKTKFTPRNVEHSARNLWVLAGAFIIFIAIALPVLNHFAPFYMKLW